MPICWTRLVPKAMCLKSWRNPSTPPLSLTSCELPRRLGCSEGAAPLKALCFRSMEYRYMDPSDVLSGAGTLV